MRDYANFEHMRTHAKTVFPASASFAFYDGEMGEPILLVRVPGQEPRSATHEELEAVIDLFQALRETPKPKADSYVDPETLELFLRGQPSAEELRRAAEIIDEHYTFVGSAMR
jgi:hypothetical protein